MKTRKTRNFRSILKQMILGVAIVTAAAGWLVTAYLVAGLVGFLP